MAHGKKKLSFWEKVSRYSGGLLGGSTDFVRGTGAPQEKPVKKRPDKKAVKDRELHAKTFSHVTIGTGHESVSVMGAPGRIKEILQDHIEARTSSGGTVIMSDCSPDMRNWVEHAKRQE